MKITFFQRNVSDGYSLENVTQNLVKHLPKEVSSKIFVASVVNQGLYNHLIAGFQAVKQQGSINHITGHIHSLAFFLNPKRTIITMADCERLMLSDWSGIKRFIYKILYFKWPARYCRMITTMSEESKKNLIKYGDVYPEKIRVIPIGVDQKFKPLNLSEDEKKEFLSNPKRKKTVLHIGILSRYKNLERLLEALIGQNIKLIRVGALDNGHRMLLKKYGIDYQQFENVSIDVLIRIYNAVDCLVLPSLVEGFGLPVVEAQACGCPVVTSNLSSLPEVAGSGAIFVDPYSAESIRDGIHEVLNNDELRMKLTEEGFKNIHRFEWPKIAKRYYALYQEMAMA